MILAVASTKVNFFSVTRFVTSTKMSPSTSYAANGLQRGMVCAARPKVRFLLLTLHMF